MNKHSRAILTRSLSFITNYRNKVMNLRNLVQSLEGSLNALEEKMPEEFYQLWFSYWGDLETVLALDNESQAQDDISKDLEGLVGTINKQLSR